MIVKWSATAPKSTLPHPLAVSYPGLAVQQPTLLRSLVPAVTSLTWDGSVGVCEFSAQFGRFGWRLLSSGDVVAKQTPVNRRDAILVGLNRTEVVLLRLKAAGTDPVDRYLPDTRQRSPPSS